MNCPECALDLTESINRRGVTFNRCLNDDCKVGFMIIIRDRDAAYETLTQLKMINHWSVQALSDLTDMMSLNETDPKKAQEIIEALERENMARSERLKREKN